MTNEEHDKDMIESIEMWLHECLPKYVEKELAWLKELRTRLLEEKSEKPSEGLEEEIEYYLDHAELKAKCNGISVAQDYFDDLTNAARHFAKWGAEHRGSSEIPNDLEEAAEEYGKVHTDEVMVSDGYHNDHTKEVFDVTPGEAFIAGAKWDRAKMMQEAVERIVKEDAGGYPYIDATELYDYTEDKPLAKKGDKVRIVIVKQE